MKTAPQSSSAETQPASLSRSQLIRACALGLLVSFFLPWIQFIGQSLSGFDLQKMPGGQKWLWIIPIFSVITMFVPVAGRCLKIAAILTGALPFCVLAYWLNEVGNELLRTVGLGGWLSLFFGLTLLILPHRLKQASQAYDK